MQTADMVLNSTATIANAAELVSALARQLVGADLSDQILSQLGQEQLAARIVARIQTSNVNLGA